MSRPRRRCYLGSQLDTKVRILAFILVITVKWLNLNKVNLSLLLWYYYIEIKCLSLFVWIVDKIWVHIMWQGGIWFSRPFHILGVFVIICKGNKWSVMRMVRVSGRMYVTSWILSFWVCVPQLGGKNGVKGQPLWRSEAFVCYMMFFFIGFYFKGIGSGPKEWEYPND